MKHFKLFIISLFLVFGYLILISYPYFFSKITRFDSLGVLSVVEEQTADFKLAPSEYRKTDRLDNHILTGEKVASSFVATENNLGIILVRFVRFGKVSDRVVFRLKERGIKNWYYEYTYRADQFRDGEYFTFGFPPIAESKNRVYVFELESLFGTYTNGVGLSLNEPKLALVYKYSRNDVTNINSLSSFIFKKFAYVARNVNFLENQLLLVILILLLFLVLFVEKKKITVSDIVKFSQKKRKGILKMILNTIKSNYLSFEKKIMKFSKKTTRGFSFTKFYLMFLNTNMKKRAAIGLLIFLTAFLYRFSRASVGELGVSSFYAGLGGQGDYDQFIRAATCVIRSFCPAILGQNFLIESSILGLFYEIWGFVGGLKAYLYLMIILSSIVATLPYVLLSRKHFLTVGGIIGSLYLSTSDYLTHMAINLPPDNGSLFTFSMFFIVYLLTMQYGTIRWLLFFGLVGIIDGLNKLTLLLNDLAVLILFIPVYFYEKAKKIKRFPFVKLNLELISYSVVPLLVYLAIYSAWEYIVQMRWSTPYYLRALIEGGSTFASSTNEVSTSINESLKKGNVLGILYYYAGSSIVMLKRLIQNASLNEMFLLPILLGLLFATFQKTKFFITKLISILVFAGLSIVLLLLFRANYLNAHDIGQYVYAWSNDIYVNVFLFASIIFLFILNFRYQAFKLALPIIPYTVMLIILTKNAPWVRLWAPVLVWSIILFSFLIDWILMGWEKNDRRNILKRLWVGPIILVLFVFFYIIPKQVDMVGKLYSGMISGRIEVEYLKWVNSELPKNAIVIAGGKSDLITVAQNLNRPIIYNSVYSQALLIKPKEVPGVKPTDFAILSQLKISEIPGVSPSDFNIIQELKNKDNFKKNKYLILEDDIFVWRGRLAGVADNVFATASGTLLSPDDYSIKVYKFNSTLDKGIYELNLK